jgi:hypothetical protein
LELLKVGRVAITTTLLVVIVDLVVLLRAMVEATGVLVALKALEVLEDIRVLVGKGKLVQVLVLVQAQAVAVVVVALFIVAVLASKVVEVAA